MKGGGEIVLASESDPHRELEEKELRQILQWAIDRLPESQKTAIVLSKCEGFGNAEIASIMELSVPAVEALIHRAKKELHGLLYRFFGDRL